MNPQDPYKAATEPTMKHALTTMQPGEQIIFEIKRHPIGMIGVYLITGFLLVAVAVFALVVGPGMSTDNKSQTMGVGAAIFLVVSVFSLAFVFISNKVYWGNGWVLTSDSITQVQQTSLFNRQSAQLSLGNLEDVTAEQNGILAHMFNYGVLKAETASERSKFKFAYCPNPNFYAQQILQAREVFEQHNRGKAAPTDQGVNIGTQAA